MWERGIDTYIKPIHTLYFVLPYPIDVVSTLNELNGVC